MVDFKLYFVLVGLQWWVTPAHQHITFKGVPMAMTIGASAWYNILIPACMSMCQWRDVHMVDFNLYFHFVMLRCCLAVPHQYIFCKGVPIALTITASAWFQQFLACQCAGPGMYTW